MNTYRLLKLATFLRTVPDDKFDLKYWRASATSPSPLGVRLLRQSATDIELRSKDCGSTACAIGWACSMPEFQELGFHWGIGSPTYTGERGIRHHSNGWWAVKLFFDLDQKQAKLLFERSSYKADSVTTPKEVADRIEQLIHTLTH